MAKKIGDLIIGVIILAFLIGGFSSFLFRADEVTNTASNSVIVKMGYFESNLSGVHSVETEFTDKIDQTAEFNVEEDQQIDTRGQDSSALVNLFSKNVLVRFVTTVGDELPVPPAVIALIISLITLTITILFLRTVLGESRI